ncbi:MAG: amidohydrolase family protein [Promethearchaeota archaeon]
MKSKFFVDIADFELFDFHCHASNLDDFDNYLNRFNIGKFCLMPTVMANDFNNINEFIERIKPLKKKFGARAITFGCMDFNKDAEKNKELLENQKATMKIQGIKIHPEQGFKINKNFLKPFFKCILDVLGQDTPIYIHTDWPLLEEKGFRPNGLKATFNKIVSFFPEFTFIMGHAGGSADYLNIWKSCKKYSNVLVETSMAPTTSPLEEIIWRIGPERLLFGTNYPYCLPSSEIVKIFSLYQVSDAERKLILNSNAEVLFSK